MTRPPPPPGRRPPPRGRPPRRRPVSSALPKVILLVFAVVGLGLFAGIMSAYAAYTSGLPDVSEIENFPLARTSTVVSADGTELATFAVEDRREVALDQIPQVMIDAQIAAEDQTFWTNPCIDFRSIVRALLQNLEAGETVSGASTICQQLVRSRLFGAELMASPGRELERKIKEAILALRLDDRYSDREGKERILEMYLNQVYYGNNAYGIWAAANAYFDKDITSGAPEDQLTAAEAALLASLVRSPSRLDPTPVAIEQEVDGETRLVVPDDAQAIFTQRVVLEQMLQSDFISQAEYDAALAERIVLAPPRDTQYLAPHAVYAVRREAGELMGSEDQLDTGGLRITTTIDYEGYQLIAEKWAQVAYDMDRLSDEELLAKYGEAAAGANGWIGRLQGRNINNDALVSINYRTGAVLAYVGSANFYGEATPAHQPNFDVIGQAYRQSGSAFKPVTYAAGFDSGAITPATMFMDVRGEIVDGYEVPNADNRERGPVRVRDALKYSLNIPVTKAQQLIGTQTVVDTAERLGLDWDPQQEAEVAIPSLTLGTIGVHMLDLAGAYGAIANGGVLMEPYLIERIEDAQGNVVYDHETDAQEGEQVISAESAYLVTDILADNTDPAANSLWGPRFQLQTDAGRRPATLKTGTTNDFRDLQAFGYLAADPDPEVTDGAIMTGVWVGNSDFTAIQDVFAADGPTFIWHDYMAEVTALNEVPVRDFTRPDGIVEVTIDPISGMLPGEFTGRTITEIFRSDRQPTQDDTVHSELRIEAETGKIWQEGCGDFATVAPSGSPDPSVEPPPAEAEEKAYLDLSEWEAEHPTWQAANDEWIDRWRGREAQLNSEQRQPFPGPLDAPLAPSEECTPGEVPTSSPTPTPSPTPSPTPVPTPTPTPIPLPTPSLTLPPILPTPEPSPTPEPGG
jgi:membrane peptidoglycan carboxypeptidase